jgi:hypothetical protein
MKNFRFTLALTLASVLMISALLAVPVSAQDPQTDNQATALMRGYRTGYSDGFPTGLQDSRRNGTRDFRNKVDYERADRAYVPNWGPLEEYRDGYQQGFAAGYNAGFDRRPFDSSIPADLHRRGDDATVSGPVDPNTSAGPVTVGPATTGPATSGNTVLIPRDTLMRIELLNNLSTDASQNGDHFQARVIEPKEYEGATLEGRVTRVKRPGRVNSNAELQLAFDQIRLPDGRVSKMSAQVIEVISGNDVGKVDSEGGVQGRDSTKDDVKKVGVAAGIGAVIGAIAGGGVGAAVGATIGAGVGTAGVLSQRGRDLRLSQGQHLRIRTAGDAEIQ